MPTATANKPAKRTPPPATVKAAPVVEPLDLKELAEGILARTIRPRVGDIRRLAEAVLKPDKKKKKKAAKKAERKLSKIPGQKGRK
jgi:hypothetical protein